MANHDCNTKPASNKTPKTERFYTVGYTPNTGRGEPSPQTLIKGHWLRECGFDIGEKLTAKIMDGSIVITCQNSAIKQAERAMEELRTADLGLKERLLSYLAGQAK